MSDGAERKLLTRSTARHLRRKRFREARKAEGEQRQTFTPNEGELSRWTDKPENTLGGESVCPRVEEIVARSKARKRKKKKSESQVTEVVSTISPPESNVEIELRAPDLQSEIVPTKTDPLEVDKLENGVTGIAERIESPSTVTDRGSTNKMANDDSHGTPSETRKSKEEIKAEREARRAAKAAAKAKPKKSSVNKSGVACENQSPNITEIRESDSTTARQIDQASSASLDKTEKTKSRIADGDKSKAELRAERRAKQEAQRAAKQATTDKQKSSSRIIEPKPISIEKPASKKPVAPPKEDVHKANLFKHLYHERELAFVAAPSPETKIHPSIARLGVQYASKTIVGSNARCVALLAAIGQLLRDFERPPQADFIRSLEASLQQSATYLHHCRPSAVSMQNALRHLKWQMTQLPSTLPDVDAKAKLESTIDTYILEQIQLAGKAISITIQKKISHGDVILTYGYSSLINKILLDAHTAGKQFRVIVADGRPWLEGREQARRLVKNGIECSYILINALSFVMPEVSKVFLGAHAILANGAVMSRAGTAQVALMAGAFNVPVLVACETHKSCERVQTDSIVYNELGNPDELAVRTTGQSTTTFPRKSCLDNWKGKKFLNLLNITYDVTPANLVTAVVTELAILPCTSVPVILRIKPSEI